MTEISASGKSHSHRAMRATMWAALDVLIPLLTGLGVFVFTSHVLSPSEFGIVALATGLAYLGTALCPGGFGEAIIQRREIDPRHLDTIFWLCVSCAAAVYALEVVLAPAVARFFKIPLLAVFIPVLAVRMFADMAAVVPNALIARAMSFHLFAAKTLFVTLLASAIVIAMLVEGYGIWALVLSQMTASFVNMIAAFVTAKWRPGRRVSFKAFRELAGYGLFSSGTQNISQVFLQNEQVLVGLFLGTTQLGFYNFSKRVLGVFNSVVAGALGAVAHPMFSGIQSETDRVRRGFLMATFVSSLVSFPIFVGLALVADRVVPLAFGERWISAVVLVKIQCAIGLIMCIGMLQAGLINSQGRANWWFYYQLLSMALTAAIIAGLARFGLPIMMTALLIKSYAIWFIPVRLCLHLLSLSAKQYFFNFRAPAAGAVAMGLAIFLERQAVPGIGNLPGLAVDFVTGSVIYGIVVFLMERTRLLTLLDLILPRLRIRKTALS